MEHEAQADRLEGLKHEERTACLIVERVLGVAAWGQDRPGAGSGRVDALLCYADGRQAALEVMWLAATADRHLDARLQCENYIWPVPGATSMWTLVVPSVDKLKGLRGLVERAVRACEAAAVRDPLHLPWEVLRDDQQLCVFAEEGAVQLHGHGIAAADGQGRVVLTQGALAMFVSPTALHRLDVELTAVFDENQQVPRHFDKLRGCPDVQERHLFLLIDHRRLSREGYDGLAFSEQLPPAAPPVPEHLTHLWIAAAYSPRVLLWSRSSGWSSHASTG